MKPGHLDTASKTELCPISTMLYWLINLKMNVDYKTISICGPPILDCIVAYLLRAIPFQILRGITLKKSCMPPHTSGTLLDHSSLFMGSQSGTYTLFLYFFMWTRPSHIFSMCLWTPYQGVLG